MKLLKTLTAVFTIGLLIMVGIIATGHLVSYLIGWL